MPDTRVERSIFVLGIFAIAALGFLVVHLWRHTHGAAAAPGTTSLSTPVQTSSRARPAASARVTTSVGSTIRAANTTSAKASSAATSPPSTSLISLAVTAENATWLEVRSGSSTGSVLYSGTLAARSSKVFRAKSLWARFGAAANLRARLNGRALRLPSGTYDATLGPAGFRRAGA